MKRYWFLLLFFSFTLSAAEETDDNEADEEEVELPREEFVLEDQWCYPCYPYDVDVDEVWFWENETMYPTRKEDSWVEDLSRPW